jgi:rhodanese-related sulfurtransferase
MIIQRVTCARLKRLLQQGASFALFDIRERGEYNLGHIPAAVSLPRRDIELRLGRLLPVLNTPAIVVGDGGGREKLAAATLGRAGCADLALLEGGFPAWLKAGYPRIAGVNVPGKTFGERIHGECEVPEIAPEELYERMRRGEKPLVIDARTPEEYGRFCIPGGINIPGGDLILWADELKSASDTSIVVNCAGRTRGIIGTQALRRLGLGNVRALRNGTMGWLLAGYDLEDKPGRKPRAPGEPSRAAAEPSAARLAEQEAIPFVSVPELQDLLRERDKKILYPIDVRSPEEYLSGHVPGFLSVPGGQAVQCADDYIAVRNGAVVFACDRMARSVMAAYWYRRMGFENVFVLRGGTEAWAERGLELEKGRPRERVFGLENARARAAAMDSRALERSLTDGNNLLVLDVGLSTEYRRGHLPGAAWICRDRLEERLPALYPDRRQPIVVTCPDGLQSTLAGATLAELDYEDVRVLEGGIEEWSASGRPLEAGLTQPLVEPNDVVQSASISGDKGAMRRYLDWELELGRKTLQK